MQKIAVTDSGIDTLNEEFSIRLTWRRPFTSSCVAAEKLRFWSKRSESLLLQSTALQEVSRHLLKRHHSGAAYCKDCCAPSDRHNASFHGAIAFNSRMVSVAVTSTVRSAPSKVFTFTNRGPWRNRSSLWR